MNLEWYKSSLDIKEHFEEINQYDALKSQLENEGLLIEGQFNGAVTSNLIEHGNNELAKLFLPEYDENEYKEDVGYSCDAKEEFDWLYYLWDDSKLSSDEAYELVKEYYEKKKMDWY